MMPPGTHSIRSRILLAALLPVVLVAALLTAVFLSGRLSDLDAAHQQRALAQARQIASSAEFALFTGNVSVLKAITQAAAREADVRAVTLIARDKSLITNAGSPVFNPPPLPEKVSDTLERVQATVRLVVQPIVAEEIPTDILFGDTPGASARADTPRTLGYVALELSRDSVLARENTLLLVGLLVTVGGLVFGILLALRLSLSVSKPIQNVYAAVERFERGELSARVHTAAGSPLRQLEEGINRMAVSIENSRGELEQRVAEATNELRIKKEEADQHNLAKSRFLAAASHDLRQPLHALGLFTGSLLEEIADHPQAKGIAEKIQHAHEAMDDILGALLEISKIDAGAIELHIGAFPLESLLRRTAETFRPLAAERGLRFSVVSSTQWVRSDRALLERIMQNLVSNALKHTASGGVVVGCRQRGAHLSLEVWDTGPGIPAEHLDDIFEEFVQLLNPERSREKGMGLGLSIVKRLSELLHHPVRVRSITGRGSVFSIDLPRANRRPRTAALTTIEHPARLAGLCIAVVDDDAVVTDAIGTLLERWGCVAVCGASDTEVLAQLKQRNLNPEMLICDYRLREHQDGLNAAAHIRSSVARAIPTVIITGDTSPDRLKEVHACGFELLHKPVSPAKLRSTLQYLAIEAKKSRVRRV